MESQRYKDRAVAMLKSTIKMLLQSAALAAFIYVPGKHTQTQVQYGVQCTSASVARLLNSVRDSGTEIRIPKKHFGLHNQNWTIVIASIFFRQLLLNGLSIASGKM